VAVFNADPDLAFSLRCGSGSEPAFHADVDTTFQTDADPFISGSGSAALPLFITVQRQYLFLIPAGNFDECRSTNPQPRLVILTFFGDIFILLGVTGQGRISLKGKRYCILVLKKC